MPRRRTRALLALGVLCLPALFAATGCGDLLGLDEKQDTPATADGAAPTAGGEGGSDTGPVDPGAGDATLADDGGGTGVDAARPDTGSGHPDAGADTGSGDPDSGCSTPGTVPDGAPETFYGSCVPSKVICNEHGYTGGLGVSAFQLQLQKDNCAALKGTWKDAPCTRTGAVFGCKSTGHTGYVCESVDISWYYPPATVADEATSCPASVGTIVLP
jgi:hypothetical protein